MGADWVSLFDGKTLTGWHATGKAEWRADRGVLAGNQGPNGEEGDLYTDQTWKDFELEVEFQVRWPANTGIWFRRTSKQPGYQADILDDAGYPDALSGSLYAMGVGFIAKNGDRSTVRKDGWNTMTIRATGNQFTIGLNGKTVVQKEDSRFPEPGSIGIQIHQGNKFKGMEVRIRKLRLRPLGG
jgi:hypothetical protein